MKYTLEEMKASDWSQVSMIYWEGIQTKIATFPSGNTPLGTMGQKP